MFKVIDLHAVICTNLLSATRAQSPFSSNPSYSVGIGRKKDSAERATTAGYIESRDVSTAPETPPDCSEIHPRDQVCCLGALAPCDRSAFAVAKQCDQIPLPQPASEWDVLDATTLSTTAKLAPFCDVLRREAAIDNITWVEPSKWGLQGRQAQELRAGRSDVVCRLRLLTFYHHQTNNNEFLILISKLEMSLRRLEAA